MAKVEALVEDRTGEGEPLQAWTIVGEVTPVMSGNVKEEPTVSKDVCSLDLIVNVLPIALACMPGFGHTAPEI